MQRALRDCAGRARREHARRDLRGADVQRRRGGDRGVEPGHGARSRVQAVVSSYCSYEILARIDNKFLVVPLSFGPD